MARNRVTVEIEFDDSATSLVQAMIHPILAAAMPIRGGEDFCPGIHKVDLTWKNKPAATMDLKANPSSPPEKRPRVLLLGSPFR